MKKHPKSRDESTRDPCGGQEICVVFTNGATAHAINPMYRMQEYVMRTTWCFQVSTHLKQIVKLDPSPKDRRENSKNI